MELKDRESLLEKIETQMGETLSDDELDYLRYLLVPESLRVQPGEEMYESRDIYLRNGEEIIGLHEIGEDNVKWTSVDVDGTENERFGFLAHERWGNNYDQNLKMIGGSFRVLEDIEAVANGLVEDGWVVFTPEGK